MRADFGELITEIQDVDRQAEIPLGTAQWMGLGNLMPGWDSVPMLLPIAFGLGNPGTQMPHPLVTLTTGMCA